MNESTLQEEMGIWKREREKDPALSCKNWARGERTRVTPFFDPVSTDID
jgi:hypothetical protein